MFPGLDMMALRDIKDEETLWFDYNDMRDGGLIYDSKGEPIAKFVKKKVEE